MQAPMLLAGHGEPHTTGWIIGFAIAITVIVTVVVLVQAILQQARRIGMQAQMAVDGINGIWENTVGLPQLQTTVDYAKSIVDGLYFARKGLGG